ncbi:MAG: cation:dicarboxylate symporter family transporter [Suipraeoptans sp.]
MGTNTKKKASMTVIKKMMIALIGGLVVGLGFLFLREQLLASGNDTAWSWINRILFQDITVEEGVGSVGIFYIIGQIFMRGLQLAIVPLVLVSLSLAMCSISNATKLGRIAGRTLLGFFSFYAAGALIACTVAYTVSL